MNDSASPAGPASIAQRFRVCLITAAISGVFCVIVSVAMIVHYVQTPLTSATQAPKLVALKTELRAASTNEALKQEVRAYDLALRQRLFQRLRLHDTGGLLLLLGLGVFVFAAGQASTLPSRAPQPGPLPDRLAEQEHQMRQARWATAGAGVVVGLALLALGASSKPSWLAGSEGSDDASAALDSGAGGAAFPSLDEMRANWPRFRGADGTGIAKTTNTPLQWNATNGENILWKTEVPARGFNSPIVWGDRVFLTGGDTNKREVLCFEATSGRLLWRTPVLSAPGAPRKTDEVPEQTGYAAATAATDGRRVYAIFATGDLAALDFNGKVEWSRCLGPLHNMYGHATSLLTWQDRLLVQLDQGEAEEGKSRLYALDPRTGDIVWQKPRALPASWATPIVIEAAGKPQIITLGDPWAVAYDASTGAELWRVECLGTDLAPSPIFGAGLVLVLSPGMNLVAIKPDGQGDVTQTHVAWKVEDNLPDTASPVCNDELVFMTSTDGMLTCLDARSGAKVWEKSLDMEFLASPTLAGDRLYVVARSGETFILHAGREYKELGRAALGERVFASPALVGDRIFIRAENHLFCIGPRTATAPGGADEGPAK
jgi:outer membrane protein assembly factor BamB